MLRHNRKQNSKANIQEHIISMCLILSVILSLIIPVLPLPFSFQCETDTVDAKTSATPTIKDFVGKWVLKDDTCYELKIYSDGSFESVDVGAGNPGLMGTMKILSNKKLQLNRTGDMELGGDEDEKTIKPKLKYSFKSKTEFTVKTIGVKYSRKTFVRVKKKPGRNYYKINMKKPVIKSVTTGSTPDSILVKIKEADDGYNYGDGYIVAYRPLPAETTTSTGVGIETTQYSQKWTYKTLSYSDMTVKRNELREYNNVSFEINGVSPETTYEVKVKVYHVIGDNTYKGKWSKTESSNQ